MIKMYISRIAKNTPSSSLYYSGTYIPNSNFNKMNSSEGMSFFRRVAKFANPKCTAVYIVSFDDRLYLAHCVSTIWFIRCTVSSCVSNLTVKQVALSMDYRETPLTSRVVT